MNLAIRIFDPTEQEYLSRILGLSGRRLKILMKKTDVSSADVVFVKPDDPGANILINSSANRDLPIVVVYGGEKESFKWTLEKPATSKGVMSLLANLQCRLGDEQNAESCANDSLMQDIPFPVAQGGNLIGELHIIMAGQTPYAIVDSRRKEIILDVASNRVFVTPILFENKARLIETAFKGDHDSLVKIDSRELGQLTEGMPYISTEYFTWLVTQEAQPLLSSGQARLDRRFQLTRWPSFTTLNHKSYHIGITGRLMKKGMSINELIAASGAPLSELIKFYNFAYAFNMLGTAQPAAAPASPLPIHLDEHASVKSEKVGILGKIIKRLAG